ncbi:MAG: hypothetical protein V1817_04945 [Candidatus Micrarchaeota archaeon]
MAKRLSRFGLVLFVVAFSVLALSCAAYTDRSFEMSAKIDADGNAHVIEKSVFTLDTQTEIDEFNNYQGLGKTTIADWRKFSKNIKYHFTGSVINPSIIAAREFDVSYSAASVSVEYDVFGVFSSEKTSNRITAYRLDESKLAFGGSMSKGEITLGNNMQFEMELPSDALAVNVVPKPGVSQLERNKLVWRGPIVGKWAISFEREKPLTSEVSEFFVQLYQQLSSWWILLIILVVFVALLALKFLKGRK